MINGDILLKYDIVPYNESQKLRNLIRYIEKNSSAAKYTYTNVLMKYAATNLIELTDRIERNTLTPEDEMLNLIRLFLEFESRFESELLLYGLRFEANYYAHILDKLNYTYVFDKDREEIIIYKKDIILENVLESISNEKLKWHLFEFNMLGSTLDSKVGTLRELYIYFENTKMRKKNYHIEEAMKYLNVVRHGKSNQNTDLFNQFDSSETKESYIQLCFKLSLQAFLSLEIVSIRESIDKKKIV